MALAESLAPTMSVISACVAGIEKTRAELLRAVSRNTGRIESDPPITTTPMATMIADLLADATARSRLRSKRSARAPATGPITTAEAF
jgi:hypothetical protein